MDTTKLIETMNFERESLTMRNKERRNADARQQFFDHAKLLGHTGAAVEQAFGKILPEMFLSLKHAQRAAVVGELLGEVKNAE